MFSHRFELSIGIRAGTLILVSLPKSLCFAMDSVLHATMDVVDCNMLCVCENAFMSVNPHNCDDMYINLWVLLMFQMSNS